jgi:hypothetical protein
MRANMTRQNAELIRSGYEAFAGGDIPTVCIAGASSRGKAVEFREFQGDQQTEDEFWLS